MPQSNESFISTMKNILAAVDFSDVTDAVVEAAYEQASLSRGMLRVVHAAAPEPVFVGYGAVPVEDIALHQEDLEASQKKLDSIVDGLKERGVEAVSNIPEGPVLDGILKEIKDHDIDLVVVGSHGHGALFNLVAGSVTQGLIHKAKVPVLVVPSKP